MKKLIWLALLVVIFLTGCAENEAGNWEVSPTFTYDKMTLYGTKGKFGIVKVNGIADEKPFHVEQGRKYDIYFLEGTNNLSGQKYKMVGTYEDTGE